MVSVREIGTAQLRAAAPEDWRVRAVRTDPGRQARELLATAGPAFLEGAAGVALALLAPATGITPATRWDACLLTI